MNDYFLGMSEKEVNDFIEAEKQMEEEKIEQYHKDIQIIRKLKKTLPQKLFHFISIQLHESVNWTNLRIITQPTGKYQQESKHFGIWIDQYCEYEDCYSGYIYIELPDKTYLCWDYWC